jgi:hypothetical protein
MRNFELNFDWLKSVDDRIKISVVVSTWIQRGGKLWGGMGIGRMRDLFPTGVADALPGSWMTGDVLEHLPGVREAALHRAFREPMTSEKIQRILPGAIVHVEEPLRFSWFEMRQFQNGSFHASDPFSMSMLYKLWQADVLRKNLEAEQGYRFDAVIRARPDVPFKIPEYIFLKHLAANELYVDRLDHERGEAGDCFALADSKTMDLFVEFFMFAYRKSSRGEWRFIHFDFYDYIMGLNLSVHRWPVRAFSPDRLVETKDIVDALWRRFNGFDLPANGNNTNGRIF